MPSGAHPSMSLKEGWSAPECSLALSGASLAVHQLLLVEPGLSKRQLAERLRGQVAQSNVRKAISAGLDEQWLVWCLGPRRAHRLRIACCRTPTGQEQSHRCVRGLGWPAASPRLLGPGTRRAA